MNCIALDDEPLALNVIEEFCSKIPFLNLVKKCTSAMDAVQIINQQNIDLVFLDIQMPNITGLEFLKILPNPPMVILTTAYSEYALQGYELNVVDYLVKPIPFERFFRAVNKSLELHNFRHSEVKSSIPENIYSTGHVVEEPEKDFFLIKVEYSTVRVNFTDILYIEGLKDYVKIYTKEKMLLTKSTMKNMEEKLPESRFLRVHKSFIVSLYSVAKIENNRIVIKDTRIPVGEQYKETFYKFVDSNRI
ncbi:MAG: response regulator transcription factor [Bacteroidales bacterium]|nr:response regulator transcription factor [Bacteroidales bacterium]MBN2820124.1 response regulator transcription factor [Bacteroidales bacterium]